MNKIKNIEKHTNAFYCFCVLLFITCLIILISLFSIYFVIYFFAHNKIYNSIQDIPKKPVAIVFGAGYYEGGRLSSILQDRVDTAIELYENGKVKKLLMTGTNNTVKYNETSAMVKYAISKGVPPEDIVSDYAGFRTYDSLYRAKEIFQVNSAILVTQQYHLFRAIYIANNFNINSIGIVSNKRKYLKEDWYETREFIAIILSFIEINITKPKPKFLGEKIPIFPND